MDISKIIKEEMSDFEWTEEVPPAKLNRYRITYINEVFIDAHNQEEANELYENLDLGSLRSNEVSGYGDDEVGLKEWSWVQTDGIEQIDND